MESATGGPRILLPDLTRREREVLQSLCRPALSGDVFAEAASVHQIASELVVSDAAVKQHLLRLYDKFGVYDRGERRRVRLAKEAIARGVAAVPAATAPGPPPSGPLLEGRDAFERRDWDATWRLLQAANAEHPLEPDDLEKLGEAGYWSNRHEQSYLMQQHAYQGHMRAGNFSRAAHMAIMLTIHYANRIEFAVAGGWFGKAQRLLEDEPEGPAHGELAIVTVLFKEAEGDWQAVFDDAHKAFELGRRFRNADLQALGLAFQGLALTHQGQVASGTKLLDEAMATAVAGELTSMSTGLVYCRMLCACLELQDFGRALEWTRVIDRCEETPRLRGLPGDCRIHRAAVFNKRGAWAQGEEEALRAAQEAETLDLPNAGIAFRELGEIRLHLGDLEGAQAAFARAQQLGVTPEPGMSRLRLARGDTRGAASSLDAVLKGASSELSRARLLPVRIDVALTEQDLAMAEAFAAELEETATTYDTPALLASAVHARGALELAKGAAGVAIEHLESARRLWQRVEAPYEAAQAGQLLGEAHLLAGDRESALAELRYARRAFERLGASRDLERTTQQLAEVSAQGAGA
jgi:DNA-binding transcriptional ArsR family regulator